MTVVIALRDSVNHQIVLGSDGQGTSDDMQLDFGGKIFSLSIPVVESELVDVDEYLRREEVYFLVSGSHYLSSFLRGAFTPPPIIDGEDFLDYLYNQFFLLLASELESHSLLKNNDGALESDAGIIIVYKNRLFNVYSDFSVVEEVNCFTSTGSGWKIATSVLTCLLKYHTDLSYEEMVKEALLVTGDLNIYCNKDITVKVIDYK